MPMPRKNPPKDAKERIERYTAQHYNIKTITKLFGVSREVFYRWLKENPELTEAREASLGVEEKEIVDELWKQVKDGNTTAAIFLLKARHHYNDRGETPYQQNAQVNITLPAATTLAEYKARIIAEQPELVKRIEREERNDGIDIDRA